MFEFITDKQRREAEELIEIGASIPKNLADIDPNPGLNHPRGWAPRGYEDHWLRAAYALIAQLRDRVEELEKKVGQ